jgi:hypothetical protein
MDTIFLPMKISALPKKVGTVPFWVFIALSAYFFITKLPLLLHGVIPFTFDHGKDSIAIFHMWQTLSPKLIGPWTSIPGLFFGPAWYYLLLPAYMIGMGHPVAPVWILVLLGIIQIWICARYFGLTAAIVVASSQTWFTLSQSAWNPFPMTLLTFVLLALFKSIEKNRRISNLQALAIGMTASLGFHFSTAFAVFYPILIASFFIIRKLLPKPIAWLLCAIGFAIPFVPQGLFEVTHGFLETHAVIRYLKEGDSQAVGGSKLSEVIGVTLKETKLAVVPVTHYQIPYLALTLEIITIGAYLYGLYITIKKKQKLFFGLDVLVWLLLPIIGFTFLHFNVWYILGILPAVVIVVSQLLDRAPAKWRYVVLGLFLLMPALKVVFYYDHDQPILQGSRQFLPVKRAAIDFIRSDAAGRSFASYHYVPDIYDYSYQYLYFWQAAHGMKLPAEFSYKPGATEYMPEKAELLAKFSDNQYSNPEVIYYVVEQTQNPAFLETWWNEQSYGQIISEHKLSEEVTVYVATPKK